MRTLPALDPIQRFAIGERSTKTSVAVRARGPLEDSGWEFRSDQVRPQRTTSYTEMTRSWPAGRESASSTSTSTERSAMGELLDKLSERRLGEERLLTSVLIIT
jgi:hypothetical protein